MAELAAAGFWAEFSAFFMRHYMMCAGWLIVTVLLIFTQIQIMVARIKKVTIVEAVDLVNHQNGLFVDVRPQERFSEGHIANSVNISAKEIKEGKIQRIENKRDRSLILIGKDKFDTDCFNSARLLKKSGFSAVSVMQGGMMEWEAQNLPVTNKK